MKNISHSLVYIVYTIYIKKKKHAPAHGYNFRPENLGAFHIYIIEGSIHLGGKKEVTRIFTTSFGVGGVQIHLWDRTKTF